MPAAGRRLFRRRAEEALPWQAVAELARESFSFAWTADAEAATKFGVAQGSLAALLPPALASKAERMARLAKLLQSAVWPAVPLSASSLVLFVLIWSGF